jgi:hypothetical protein
MFHESGSLTASSLRVMRNLARSARVALGAGIYTTPSGATLTALAVAWNNVTFVTNGYGGGLYVAPVSGRVLMTALVVRNNTATLLGPLADFATVCWLYSVLMPVIRRTLLILLREDVYMQGLQSAHMAHMTHTNALAFVGADAGVWRRNLSKL